MATIQHNGTTRKLTPLLMKDFLVAQTLKGLKTQTRRLNGLGEINESPEDFFWSGQSDGRFEFDNYPHPEKGLSIECPYGKIGDIIWVRETFYQLGHWIQEGKTKSGADAWAFIPHPNSEIFYEENKPAKFIKARSKASPEIVRMYKRNSLFMPITACRLFLEITDIRPERLLDITEEDAIQEGIEKLEPWPECPDKNRFKVYFKSRPSTEEDAVFDPVFSFFSLITSINGNEVTIKNPWVWRISFKVIPKPDNWPA